MKIMVILGEYEFINLNFEELRASGLKTLQRII